MLRSYTRLFPLCCTIIAAFLPNVQQSLAHLTTNECVQGSGCVAGQTSGQATFQFTANTTANPPLHSGNFTFTDASAGISVSSGTLLEYGNAGNESERLLSFQLQGGAYSEARLFVTDSGPSASDSFRIQLLDSSGIPVIEIGGPLLSACAGGITIATACVPPVPCELQLTVACAVASPSTNTPNTGACTITGTSAEIDFFYTLRNTGTAGVPLSSLSGTDAFGPLDLSSLGAGSLQPGEEITLTIRETVSGTFPLVNTVTITSTQNTNVCSDMATVTIRQESSGPGPGEVCVDSVMANGWIVGTPSGAKATFSVHGRNETNALVGALNYLDHRTHLQVTSTAITGYTNLSAVARQLTFNVTIDGVAGTAIVRVFDNGSGGTNDRFEIQLSNGYTAGGELGGDRPGGGNVNIRACDGGQGGGGTGGGTGGGGAEGTCPLTIGYWKNHDTQLSRVLNSGAIALGDRTVGTVAEALSVLTAANSTDARLMLRAQLLATLLNLQNGSSPMNTGTDIRTVVEEAVQFLTTHSTAVTGEHPDRAEALSLKDQLDAYNNSRGSCVPTGSNTTQGSPLRKKYVRPN